MGSKLVFSGQVESALRARRNENFMNYGGFGIFAVGLMIFFRNIPEVVIFNVLVIVGLIICFKLGKKLFTLPDYELDNFSITMVAGSTRQKLPYELIDELRILDRDEAGKFVVIECT